MLRVALPVKIACVASYCVSEIFHTERCLTGYLPLHRNILSSELYWCVCVCVFVQAEYYVNLILATLHGA